MSEAATLYHEALVAKAREARAPQRLEQPAASVTVDNPLCGDRVTLDLVVDSGKVGAVGHRVRGCLLCQAATALIADHAPGATAAELRGVAAGVQRFMADGELDSSAWPELAMFAPVRAARSRHRCVTLPFAALTRALDEADADGR